MSLTTMYPAINNSPRTTLAAAITAMDTELTLENASVLPAAPNLMVLGTGDDAEIISYTAISGNVVTGLVRGVNGTIAGAWPINTIVARNFTAADHEALRLNILDLDNRKIENVYWGDIDGVLSMQTDLNTALTAKAPLASPALTGNPTAPTQSISDDSTKLATTAFVQAHAPIHLQANVSAGTTFTISDSRITSTMTVINCWFAYPDRVASEVSWSTSNGSITLTSNFVNSNMVNIDLIEVN